MMVILLGAIVYGLSTGVNPGVMNNVGFAGLHLCVLGAGIWPALVKGQGKRQVEPDVIDLNEARPHLSLVKPAAAG